MTQEPLVLFYSAIISREHDLYITLSSIKVKTYVFWNIKKKKKKEIEDIGKKQNVNLKLKNTVAKN